MDTIEVTLSVPLLEHDRYIGVLSDWATGFQQTDSTLIAYVPVEEWSGALRERVAARLRADGYTDALEVRVLGERNWNAEWEASLTPVRVGPFLLCPTTGEEREDTEATVLRIDPKQSFGTGHHATTRLVLRLLAGTVASGDTVIDVGTGTGVLAIAAARLGASSVLGVDIEPGAVQNARENVAQNGVEDRVTIREGSIDTVPADRSADVIVANMTRHPLLELLPDLGRRLSGTGHLLLSGLLTSDRPDIREVLHELNFEIDGEHTEDGWWAVHCTRGA
ncbi:ribosomal protein L11 methyltransferase [Salinibacter sp. 10B]|uniref:50S ribosomal protein L11 methyltransferase n=1 Tax=Salinibacter sp. 10B TaxID=1923971 RepID=UPI000CF55DFE|nr:50S ribosomal protein L11 methyltransferase [Salinibacter sp. 10B]PQJ34091.1 ribosomal protein L11 methyltransferase [Salinibacter sp. 10B]